MMNLNKVLVVLIMILISGCSDSLEKKYNPQSFSGDLKELNETDQIILKNIFMEYEKRNDVNTIADNDVVLIPSLTFREIKDNYSRFHDEWKNDQKKLLIESLEKRWVHEITSNLLRDYITLKLDAQKVRNPENGYIARRIILTNQFDDSLSLRGKIVTNKKTSETGSLNVFFTLLNTVTNETTVRGPGNSSHYIAPNDNYMLYVNDYEFRDEYKPVNDEDLSIVEFDNNFKFAVDDEIYSLSSISFVNERYNDLAIEKIKPKRELAESIIDSQFSLKVWPYDQERLNVIHSKILSDERLK